MANNSNELLVKVRVEIGDLSKGLTKAEKEIGNFGDKAEKAAKKTEDIGKSADDNNKSLKKLADGLENTVGGVEDLTRSSGDLSDKMRGVSKIAKGATSSLSGVGAGALVAVGGILAVAAAIGTALYFYGKHRAEAFDLELQYKRLNERVKEYEKSLWGVNKAQFAGSTGSAQQLTSLRLLKAQVENTALSQKDRSKAIDALRKKYPSYFKDLSNEKILLGEVGTAYNSLTDDIIKNARAKAGLQALTANLKKQFALEFQLLKNSEKLQKKADERAILRTREKYITMSDGAAVFNSKEKGFNENIADLLDDQLQIAKDIVSVQGEASKLAGIISENGGILPIGSPGDSIEDGTREAVTSIEFQVDELGGALKKGNAELIGITDTFEPISLIDKDALSDDEIAMRLHAAELGATIQNFAEDFQMLVAGAIRDTAISLGESIGEALAEGENVIGAMGKSLLGSMGKFLGELGKLLITYGALAVAKGVVDLAISSGFGPVVIAAGAAAIVIGIALVAASSAMAAKTGAGSSSGGGSRAVAGAGSYSGSSGGSSSRASSGGSGGGTYVFEIQGTKLVGVISNTLKRNNALGGGLTISTTPTG